MHFRFPVLAMMDINEDDDDDDNEADDDDGGGSDLGGVFWSKIRRQKDEMDSLLLTFCLSLR